MSARILIVDDDVFNLMSLEMILKSLNLSCDKAFHGHEALEKLRIRAEKSCADNCRQYGLIIMDCNMPIMNGYELLNMLRSNIATRLIPIILLTARADESYSKKLCF